MNIKLEIDAKSIREFTTEVDGNVIDIKSEIDPIYDELKLTIGEYVYRINEKGEILEKLFPLDTEFDNFVNVGKLNNYVLENFPDNYEELVDELLNDIEDNYKKLKALKHLSSLSMSPLILDYGLGELETKYWVKFRTYVSTKYKEIDDSMKPKVGKIEPKVLPEVKEEFIDKPKKRKKKFWIF